MIFEEILGNKMDFIEWLKLSETEKRSLYQETGFLFESVLKFKRNNQGEYALQPLSENEIKEQYLGLKTDKDC